MPGKRLRSDAACFFGAALLRRLNPEIAQNGDATFRNDLFADLMHRRQYSPDAAGRSGVRYWAIGHRKMRLLGEAGPLEVKLKILNPGRRAAIEGRIDQRLEDVPDFRPAITDRKTKRVRMLETENGDIRVIVKGNVVRPPP